MLSGKEFGDFGHGHLGEGGVFEICFLMFFSSPGFNSRLQGQLCRLPLKKDSLNASVRSVPMVDRNLVDRI